MRISQSQNNLQSEHELENNPSGTIEPYFQPVKQIEKIQQRILLSGWGDQAGNQRSAWFDLFGDFFGNVVEFG